MNEDTNYVTTREACKLFNVSDVTLRKWDQDGKIQTYRTPGNQRRYSKRLLKEIDIRDSPPTQKQKVCYCRVSSQHQKDDLERQKESLRERFPNHRIIEDVGSGINWKRPGLKTILELAMQNKLTEVVVAHRDRLCRFAFELIQWFLEQNNVKLVVLNGQFQSSEQELAEDLLSIIHVFSCRKMGNTANPTSLCLTVPHVPTPIMRSVFSHAGLRI